jgi:malate/lactate dehydrogenase
MSVPVVLGQGGVKTILEYHLAPDEQEGLEKTAEALKAAVRVVNNCLS